MPLKIYLRNGVYYMRGTVVAGREIHKSCRTADREIAARQASQEEAREWKRHLDGPGAVLTFQEAYEHYLKAGRGDRFAERVAGKIGDRLVKDITPGLLRSMAIEMFPGCTGATMNRQGITPAVAIINCCAEDGMCSPIKVKRFKTEHKIKEPATLEWVNAFVANAGPHVGALCMFMFMTGARVGEAIALRWEDVDLEKRTALIRQTKVGVERVANLPQPLVVKLANLTRDPQRNVFSYMHPDDIWRAWEGAVKSAGIKLLTPHCCRHGFATALLRRGVDVVTVAHLGGWKTPAIVLKTYAHAIKDPQITDILAHQPDSASKKADNYLQVVKNSK